ncbi:hypothetical protein FOA52_003783, partial [Chlamydomonas sp. UWO 241]
MGTPSALRAGASGLRKTPRPAASRTLLLVSLQVLLVCTTPRGSAAEVESFAARAACCAADPPGTFRPIINNTFNTAFIIGSQKSGTTWLFTELLSRHPLLRPWRKIYKTIHTHNGLNLQHPAQSELVKEPHYFDTLPAKSFDDYLAGFSAEKKLRNTLGKKCPITSAALHGLGLKFASTQHQAAPQLLPGFTPPPACRPWNRTATFIDATPDYLHIPAAACRLSAAFPKARLLLVLRDPVRRAFSAHNMMKLEAANTKFPMGKFGAEVASEHAALWAKGCSYEDVREGASGGTSAGGGGASGGGGGGRGGDGGGGGAPRLLQGSANETAAAGRGGARSAAGRASAARGAPSPALGNHPSWNDCFRCSFTYCGTYAGAMPMPLPVAGAAGEGRRDAVKGGCSFKDMPRAGLVRRGLYAYQ